MAYLDGELSADQATEALSHLKLCSECRTLAADFRGVSRELLAWEVESPEIGISSELSAALGERLQKRQAETGRSPRLSTQSDDESAGSGPGCWLSSAWLWD